MNSCFTIENELIKNDLLIRSGKIEKVTFTDKTNGYSFTFPEGSEELSLTFRYGLFGKSIVSDCNLTVVSSDCRKVGDEAVCTLRFAPVSIADSEIEIALIYSLENGKSYIRKHIEISCKKQGSKKLILDNICFEKIPVASEIKSWSVPEQKNSHIPGFALSLGQPVYLDRLYMGCEFPAALNNIESNMALVTYFSGKTLSELTADGKYVSHSSVLGCAESDIFEQVQKAFFAYIKDISKPVRLRRQYNSWYDHMLNITNENVTSSFLEIDKGLNMSGEPALDSFVADDGWNDYTKGFWCFNDKFPNELYPFSALSKSLGSDFGLWVGPRGGYTTDTPKFARHIQKAGNGYVNKNAKDICVASEKYVNLMADMMCDFENRFDLNYFKLDGFAQYPCKNKRHDHMTGGYNQAYFYTDVWEKWIGVFEKLNSNGPENFWINLTCYAAPSAWYLQWVNSLWMQISNDVGFMGDKKVSDKDRMLSYRDECYFDFYRTRQFQFPQRALYNHDPIYGNEAKVKLSDGEFRDYLFTMATRGTAFWELYYSYNMMNENKWRINYAVLRFIEENTDVLSNSVIFGDRPSKNSVYGFSCFNEKEGIVSVRNASDKAKTFTFALDEKIGVKSSFPKSDAYVILPYTESAYTRAYGYGDTLTIDVAPFETKIFHFGKQKKPLDAIYVKARSFTTLEVQFNQTVNISKLRCDGNKITKAELLADYMTVRLEFAEAFEEKNTLVLTDVSDIMGNGADIEICFPCYEDGKLPCLYGSYDFSIQAEITSAEETFSQGNQVSLKTDAEKRLIFTVGDCTVKSASPVKVGDKVCAVRERNNVLKLYINGRLDKGAKSNGYLIEEENAVFAESVKLFDRALPFDEA